MSNRWNIETEITITRNEPSWLQIGILALLTVIMIGICIWISL